MSPLNSEKKKLVFDYCMGLTSKNKTTEAEQLISSSNEAAKIHDNLKAILKPLDTLEPQLCQDELVERTVRRVNNLANFGQRNLQQLLASEQSKKVIRIGFRRNLIEMAAVAAAIVLIAGVLVPTFNIARQHSWQQRCKKQMASIFQGLRNYLSDHDGQPPSVETVAGAPWWKVGDQGSENQSNTRHIYLLPKGGYVELSNFVCPGCKGEKPLRPNDSQIRKLKDFPSRRYVTYSFQIRCDNMTSGKLLCRKVLMADWNPLFEQIPEDFTKQLQLRLNRALLTLNSNNHNRRGQNVLFGDGSVEFLKTRFAGISDDDIFTLQDTDIYHGCEVPSCETDFFLAP
jgi:prepilin-type processing-associated H-X9-DG protein